jgi:hypothetical protein
LKESVAEMSYKTDPKNKFRAVVDRETRSLQNQPDKRTIKRASNSGLDSYV